MTQSEVTKQMMDILFHLVHSYMQEKRYTQGKIAELAGTSDNNLSQILAGNRVPSLTMYNKIIEACGCYIVVTVNKLR